MGAHLGRVGSACTQAPGTTFPELWSCRGCCDSLVSSNPATLGEGASVRSSAPTSAALAHAPSTIWC